MKSILYFFISFYLLINFSISIQDEVSYKINVYIFDKPLIFSNKMKISSIPNAEKYPFLKLQAEFWSCKKWEEVLALHSPNSAKLIEEKGMKKYFEKMREKEKSKIFIQTYTAYLTVISEKETIMLVQSVPFKIDKKLLSKLTSFRVQGYRKLNGVWKIDKTLQKSNLGIIVANTNPKNLKEAIYSLIKFRK